MCADDRRAATLRGCGGRERYVYFDLERSALTVRRESLRVSWYRTSGRYDDERTGGTEQDAADINENPWTAPAQGGLVRLWVVLRDVRGGAGVREWIVNVR